MAGLIGPAVKAAVKAAAEEAAIKAAEEAAAKVAQRAATRAAPKAAARVAAAPLAVKPARQRSIMSTPDLRAMDAPSALAVARGEPHLIQDPTGQYVGAPRGVASPEDLLEMRRHFDADVAAGAAKADWYPRARDWIENTAGRDPERQTLLARELALWSAQANPDTNLNFAVQGHNAYEMGTPRAKVRTGQQGRSYRQARDLDAPIALGPKTGVYGQHLDPNLDFGTTGTNDIWHARALGYTNPNGAPFSGTPGAQAHRFMDYETLNAVNRANDIGLASRSDWTAHEIQAAPWVGGKGRSLAVKRFKPGANELTPEQMEWGLTEAGKTYPDYAAKYTGSGTYEQTPFVNSEHLPDVVAGDYDTRAAYSADPRSSWADEDGRDLIYDALGLYQTPTGSASGLYFPPGREREINPASVAHPLVGLSGGGMDRASKRAMTLAEGLRAYGDVQGAGAGHVVLPGAKAGAQTSVFSDMGRSLDPDEMARWADLGQRYGLSGAIGTDRGALLTSFDRNPPNSRQVLSALKSGLSDEGEALTGAPLARVGMDGVYVPMFEGTRAQGSGRVTRRLFNLLDKYGDVPFNKLDTSEAIMQRMLAKRAQDAEMAANGSVVREDAQNARDIWGNEGLSGLRRALAAGKYLPAAAPLALPALLEQQSDEPDA